MDSRLRAMIANIMANTEKYELLEERIAVIEENTCDHESRLEDLEKAVEELMDKIDDY